MHVNWLNFVFWIVFEVSNHSEMSDSPHQPLSSPTPHPFYLSFESEHTEERLNMPLNLERNTLMAVIIFGQSLSLGNTAIF
jgi:hypothetical protein